MGEISDKAPRDQGPSAFSSISPGRDEAAGALGVPANGVPQEGADYVLASQKEPEQPSGTRGLAKAALKPHHPISSSSFCRMHRSRKPSGSQLESFHGPHRCCEPIVRVPGRPQVVQVDNSNRATLQRQHKPARIAA
jgi:hypothetical protein